MNIKIDSRKIEKGDTFIALRTLNNDGHKYINDAIKNGASRVIAEYGKYNVETILVPDTKDYLINYLKENYYDKIKNLKLIGLTGTNGKTTTCYTIYQALNKIGHKCAYIGTMGFYLNDKRKELANTTPEILDLYEMLLECVKENVEYVVMEVSSQGLSLKRVEGLLFDYAIFTNLTRDHLDYHKTMENYALAKQKLFYMLKDNGKAIVNIDDNYKDYYLLDNTNITYGFNKSDYQIIAYKLDSKNTIFTILHNNKLEKYQTNLLGKHNIYNLTCLIILLDLIGINYDIRNIILNTLASPIGRLERFDYKSNLVIVDYAHTPDALEKVIDTVKEFSKGNIYVVIGCGGDRDPSKRPIMARIATSECDYAIFTNDNPRTEDPDKIFNDMIQNINKTNYEIIKNRYLAIKKGIQMCKKNDILLILGKGHEDYQIIGKHRKHFDDREVVEKLIRRFIC